MRQFKSDQVSRCHMISDITLINVPYEKSTCRVHMNVVTYLDSDLLTVKYTS